MERFDELRKLTEALEPSVKTTISKMIYDIIFLEKKLDELKNLPFIEVNPRNPSQQRATPAAKQYKEFLQQYNNCLKIMLSALCKSETTEDSPLREYLKKLRREDS